MRRVRFASALFTTGLLAPCLINTSLADTGLANTALAGIALAGASQAGAARASAGQASTTLLAARLPNGVRAAGMPVARRGDDDGAQATTEAGKAEAGFVSLFDGKTLNGWTLIGGRGEGYGAKDGVLFCAKGGGGKLLSEKEYSDFVLRFDFKMPPEGSNNGLGIRAPAKGDAAYVGIELQILEEKAALAGKWGKLNEAQYHGSVYGVIAAKRGAQKPAGEWNEQEVTVKGRQITVRLNGEVILDANLDTVTDAAVLEKHPGLKRTSGHIGFLGHGDYLEFRNIRIKPL